MSRDALLTGTVSAAETVIHADGNSPVVIDDGANLFGATFHRAGPDLLLLNDGAPPIRIVDYFRQGGLPDLSTGDGGLLRGATVETLAGPEAPGQYAQTRLPEPGLPIGQVETLDGGASVQRADGTVQALRVGMKVFQNDVVATEDGSGLSLTFSDGTIFSLAAESRMVLDHLIYDPAGSANSAAFSLVQGSFVFIAGQVAKTGGMEITTPAATMGIRGTTVRVDVTTIGGETTVECTLNHDPDGGLGRIEIFDLDGNLLETVTGTDFRWLISTEDSDLVQTLRTPEDIAADAILLGDAVSAFRLALRRVASGETFVDLPGKDSTTQPDVAEPDNDFNTGAGQELSDDPGQVPDPPVGGVPPVPPEPEVLPALPVPPSDAVPDLDDTRLEIDEDTRLAGVLDGTDPNGDTLTYALVAGPGHGTVTLADDGSYVYVPDADFAGTDLLEFTATDPDGNVATAVTTITVAAVNDAPRWAPVAIVTGEDGALDIDLASFVSDPDAGEDGSTLTYSVRLAGAPDAGGLFTLVGRMLSFQPGEAFQALRQGEQQDIVLEVTATDAAGASSTAELIVTVTGSNDAPVLGVGRREISEDAALSLDLSTLATDVDDGAAGLTYALTAAPVLGSASVENGVLSYTPGTALQSLAAGESRVVALTVSATDAAGAAVQSDVFITVNGRNDAPMLTDGTLDAIEDGAAQTIDLAALAFDAEDGAEGLTFALLSAPGLGTAQLDGSLLTFSAGSDFQGLAVGESRVVTMRVSATDSAGAVTETQVSVTVSGVNDAPEGSDLALLAPPGRTVVGQAAAIDIDGDTVEYSLTSGPALGSAEVDAATGMFSYTARPGAAGADSFQLLVTDGQGGRDTITVRLAVGADERFETMDGQTVTAMIDSGGAVALGATPIEASALNIAFVLDSSGSIGAEGWAQATADVADAIALLADDYAGAAMQIDIRVISYSSGVERTDTYDLLTDTDALIAEVLALDWQAGGTRWDLAFTATEKFFDGEATGEDNYVFFVTDGVPAVSYQATLDSLTDAEANGYSVDIEAFGIGASPNMETLDSIDSDGSATAVETPADLAEGLAASPIFPAALVDFQLWLVADGADLGMVAGLNELDTAGADYALDLAEIDGLAPLLGGDNTLTAIATFDFDGDLTTTADRQAVTSIEQLGRADAAVTVAGSAESTLIFGSAEADSLDGGGGRDVLLGLEGDDTLTGGAGADQVLGGAGDDLIVIGSLPAGPGEVVDGGDGTDALAIGFGGAVDALFDVVDLSGIEVLDMENGAGNSLTLTLDDVLDITGGTQSDIGALIDAAAPLLGIRGDAGDVVTFSGEEAGTATDDTGGELLLYDLMDGAGEVLASLAIDADIVVQTLPPAA